jgi:hypothetical protein
VSRPTRSEPKVRAGFIDSLQIELPERASQYVGDDPDGPEVANVLCARGGAQDDAHAASFSSQALGGPLRRASCHCSGGVAPNVPAERLFFCLGLSGIKTTL